MDKQQQKQRFIALVPAAGVGSRMGSDTPKQYLPLVGGKTMIECTVEALLRVPGIERVLVAVSLDDEYIRKVLPDSASVTVFFTGGKTRGETVGNTLRAYAEAFPEQNPWVLVHDAARPLVQPGDIEALIDAAQKHENAGDAVGAVLAMPVSDTVKRADEEGMLTEDVSRDRLWRIATPQIFRLEKLLQAVPANPQATDESSAVRAAGDRVAVVSCAPANIKVTTPGDLAFARERFAPRPAVPALRVGIGYDSHRLVEGRPFILGGVEIPHMRGLDGHSDADALLHALTDAVLGAANLGNIGIFFPDNDPAYQGADSAVLLAKAWQAVREKGWGLVNADCVVVAQKPKLNPHVPAMQQRIAQVLGVPPDLISIKPKTNEKLGFEGREEGISTQVVVLLQRG